MAIRADSTGLLALLVLAISSLGKRRAPASSRHSCVVRERERERGRSQKLLIFNALGASFGGTWLAFSLPLSATPSVDNKQKNPGRCTLLVLKPLLFRLSSPSLFLVDLFLYYFSFAGEGTWRHNRWLFVRHLLLTQDVIDLFFSWAVALRIRRPKLGSAWMDQYSPNGNIPRLPCRVRPLVGRIAATTLAGIGMTTPFLSLEWQQQLISSLYYIHIYTQAFSSLVNKSRVVFQLPTSGSSGDDQDGLSSAVAKTTSVSDTSSSDQRQCDPTVGVDRKKPLSKTPLSLVAIEFLLDQQRSFLPSSRLQPFQVTNQFSLPVGPLARWPRLS